VEIRCFIATGANDRAVAFLTVRPARHDRRCAKGTPLWRWSQLSFKSRLLAALRWTVSRSGGGVRLSWAKVGESGRKVVVDRAAASSLC
jgi:hypothetical protein